MLFLANEAQAEDSRAGEMMRRLPKIERSELTIDHAVLAATNMAEDWHVFITNFRNDAENPTAEPSWFWAPKNVLEREGGIQQIHRYLLYGYLLSAGRLVYNASHTVSHSLWCERSRDLSDISWRTANFCP